MSTELDQTIDLLQRVKARAGTGAFHRGVEYFEEGRISEMTKERRGWIGIAHGMRDYDVWIDPAQGMYECNCPAPAPCKHVVALTLTLQEKLRGGPERIERSPSDGRSVPSTSATRPSPPSVPSRSSVPSTLKRPSSPKASPSRPKPFGTYEATRGSDRLMIGFRDESGAKVAAKGIDDLLEWMPSGVSNYFYFNNSGGISIPYQLLKVVDEVGRFPFFFQDRRAHTVYSFPPSFALTMQGLTGTLSVEFPNEAGADGWKEQGPHFWTRDVEDRLELGLIIPRDPQLVLSYKVGIPQSLKSLIELRPTMEKSGVSGLEALPNVKTEGPLALLYVEPLVDKEDLIALQLKFRFAYFDDPIDEKLDATPQGMKHAAVFPPYSKTSLPRGAFALSISAEGRPAERKVKKEKKLIDKLSEMLTQNGNRRVAKGRILSFFQEELPTFQEAGVVIHMPEELMSLKIKHAQSLFELKNSSGTDWFGGRIEIPGLSAADVERALAAVRNRQSHLLLSDGRWVRLEDLQLGRLLRTLDSLGLKNRKDGSVDKISLGQATALMAEQEARTERLSAEIRRRLVRWSGGSGAAASYPLADGFAATLRPYQLTGVSFLLERHAAGVGAILADDMGLGKTVQGLGFLHTLRKQKSGRYLIVCPPAALAVWRNEAERFCPTMPVQYWHGPTRRDQQPAKSGIILTTYGTLQKDQKLFSELKFDTVLIDEAQTLKNHRSASAQSMRSLQSRTFFCLTGTPLENHPLEIWSLMDLILPGLLGTHSAFRSMFGQTLDEDAKASLKKRIAPFLLRRTRDAVLKDLPPRTEQDLRIPMLQKQSLAYEKARREAVDVLAKAGSNYLMLMLPYLMKLRRLACHPDLGSKTADPMESGKIIAFDEMAEELEETARGILVFSQFTDMLDLFERYLDGRKQRYLRLDGSTTALQRERRVREFQEGTIPYFLISLRAGGTALTLHRADTVLHLDPWWNPAVEEQATARAHRMGQKHPVFVYRFFSETSVEEKVAKLQEKKRRLFDDLFGTSQKSAVPFDRDELMALLSGD